MITNQKDFNSLIIIAEYLNIGYRNISVFDINEFDEDVYVEYMDNDGLNQQAILPLRVLHQEPLEDGNYKVNLNGQSVKTYYVDRLHNYHGCYDLVTLKDYQSNEDKYVFTYHNGQIIYAMDATTGQNISPSSIVVRFQLISYDNIKPLKGNTRINKIKF